MKTETFYCVVDPTGIPLIFFARYWRKDSIRAFLKGGTTTWDECRKRGFVCKKYSMVPVK